MLLDERRLGGVRGVERRLSPKRYGALVDSSDVETGLQSIEALSQSWGGGAGLLFPGAPEPHPSLDEPWESLATDADLDWFWNPAAGPNAARYAGALMSSVGGGEPLMLMLLAQGRPRGDWLLVRVPELERDDPWLVSYVATFGIWPRELDPEFCEGGDLSRTPRSTGCVRRRTSE
jgi:hypothetical protein